MARSKAPLVVIAHKDGRRLKGYVFDFLPTKDRCRIFPSAAAKQEEGEQVEIRDLKAIFFLRDPADAPASTPPAAGRRKLEVIFPDKERLEGTTEGYSKDRLGFFMVPEDPTGKIMRAFIVNANVTSVKWL
jgi:hypothetical protein